LVRCETPNCTSLIEPGIDRCGECRKTFRN
jgi:hypothetical protein